MKRIALIFSLAGTLALCALVLGRPAAALVEPKPFHVEPKTVAVQPPVARQGSITVSSQLSDPLLAVGGPRDEYLDVDLTGASAPDARRAPVNLAVVLDRSGSMSGEKLESARRAAHALVDRLAETDRLAFITFGSNVTPLFPSTPCVSEAKGRMHRLIDGIYDMGGTNLSGGLQAGLRAIEPYAGSYAVNRVILISDGEANEGIVSRPGLAAIARGALREHVSVTALGVGADFDEDTMQSLAEQGGGNYRFLQTGGELASIFDGELRQLAATVATDAVLHLHLAPGVSLSEVYGYAYDTAADGALTVHLPDFAANEHRKLVVALRAPAEREGSEQVVSARLDYVDVLHSRAPVQTAWNHDARVIPDQAQAELGRDRDTYAQVARVQAAGHASRAATLYSSGDVSGALDELKLGRKRAMQLNVIAKDATLGAAVDKVLPAPAALAPPAESEEGRITAKKMKADAFQFSR